MLNAAAASTNSKAILTSTAQETQKAIPTVLRLRPDAPPTGYQCLPSRYTPLSSRFFPNLSTEVQVVDADTYDTAIQITNAYASSGGDTTPVCVLNMASEKNPGGGWLTGAMAQEEALCYRSTLSATLKRRFYPLKEREAIYSPKVVIFRESYDNNHRMMDLQRPDFLPAVSVISAAALRRPAVNTRTVPARYVYPEDRLLMKDKMRVILRVAARNRHRSLVLGALGCGVFANPSHDVADCWREVLQEQEFRGWWDNITFAVLKDVSHGTDNFEVFHTKLHGLRV
ncbi:hypothetical protein AOCH_001278 [Aspergillus ochraceoroseus]|uniref:Microbial-type PARG catalytic domain-containing protein n=1 Tax=Aspergillus ochraceoroseus TaxID=138278 RepID=A0A0F8WV60_9EURO|nr:hypothetical protein AOCH_001278 [Aspergillus ochraceoroseus]